MYGDMLKYLKFWEYNPKSQQKSIILGTASQNCTANCILKEIRSYLQPKKTRYDGNLLAMSTKWQMYIR